MSFGNPNILFSSGTNLKTTPQPAPPGAPGLPNGSVPVVTLTTPGPPTTGTWIATQAVIDSKGQTWLCTESGTPGTFVPVATVTNAIANTPLSIATGNGVFGGDNYQFATITVTHNLGRIPGFAIALVASPGSPGVYGSALTTTQAQFQFQNMPSGNTPVGSAPTVQEFASGTNYDYQWICVG